MAMTSAQMLSLITELDVLAAATWHKIKLGPSRGLAFGEESLTDHNLFELDDYLAHNRPWSHIFRDGTSSKAHPETHPSADIVSSLSASLGSWATQAVPTDGGEWADAAEQGPVGAGIPAGEGHREQLPPWLRAVREATATKVATDRAWRWFWMSKRAESRSIPKY
jgi:hypothetical protein